MSNTRTFKIYRYDPEKDAKPYMQTINNAIKQLGAAASPHSRIHDE